MPNEEWGVKRLCPACETRFYDLKNDPMTCPSCGAEYDMAMMLDGGKAAAAAAAKEKAKAEAAEEPIIEDVEDVLDDDESPATDDSLLDDDDDETVSLEEVKDVPANDDDD